MNKITKLIKEQRQFISNVWSDTPRDFKIAKQNQSNTTALLEGIIAMVEGNKRVIDCDNDYLCTGCGSHNECECDGYNESSTDTIDLLKETLKELNK